MESSFNNDFEDWDDSSKIRESHEQIDDFIDEKKKSDENEMNNPLMYSEYCEKNNQSNNDENSDEDEEPKVSASSGFEVLESHSKDHPENNEGISEGFSEIPFDNAKSEGIIEIEENGAQGNSIISYRTYCIFVFSHDSKKILCYRRYNNFNTFAHALRKNFPEYIFPKLSEKSVYSKITKDTSFFSKRQKELKFFLNFINNHPFLKEQDIFHKFIHDPEFDDKYYNSYTRGNFVYPRSEKLLSNNIFKNAVNFFFSSDGGSGQEREDDNEIVESKIKKIKAYYTKYEASISKMMAYLTDILKQKAELTNNINDLNRNILYISPENIMYQKTKELSKLKFQGLDNLIDRFDEYVLILQGILECIYRYEEFKTLYLKIKSLIEKMTKGEDKKACEEEFRKAQEDKEAFQRKFFEEVENCKKNYGDTIFDLVASTLQYFQGENEEELKILSKN